MDSSRIRRFVRAAACAALAACSRPAAQAMTAGALILTGEVVPGVECPALRLDDGRTVALSQLPAAFTIGSRVTVSGPGYAGSATCQQEVFVVETAEAAR